MNFVGSLLSIHIAEKAGAPMRPVANAQLVPGVGIVGDRYASGEGFYSARADVREVTLIESETLEALARDHDMVLRSDQHRRNLTTKGVPLNHLVGRRFAVGEVVLEGARLSTPCAYLDQLLGLRVCRLLHHRAGLNCRILRGGSIRVGDVIC